MIDRILDLISSSSEDPRSISASLSPRTPSRLTSTHPTCPRLSHLVKESPSVQQAFCLSNLRLPPLFTRWVNSTALLGGPPYHPRSSQFSISTNAHTTPLLWLMAELGRVPGQLLANPSEVRERTGERKARQGCRSCGFGACLSAPALPPLSISSLAPSGTHALARPQEPGSQGQGKGRGGGEQDSERDRKR